MKISGKGKRINQRLVSAIRNIYGDGDYKS